VYGLLRTSDAASSVSPGAVWSSMAMFIGFYIVLLVSFFTYARKWLRAGPDLSAHLPAK
jgi:cytochrome d ubiquinol oxidase subunit I